MKALPDETHSDLARIDEAGDRRCILRYDGNPVSKDALYSRIKVWLTSVNAGQYTPHGLRKCAVNTLLEAGCTVSEVSSITGQTLQMVEHYAKQRDDLKLARRAMGKWESG